MHENAPGMAAFTLVCSLIEALVEKGTISQVESNAIIEIAAQRNEQVPESNSSTNADAAKIIRKILGK